MEVIGKGQLCIHVRYSCKVFIYLTFLQNQVHSMFKKDKFYEHHYHESTYIIQTCKCEKNVQLDLPSTNK